MYIAPHITLNGCLVGIPDGVGGIVTTVSTMRKMVNDWRVDPGIISAARSIVFMCPQKDDESEARALFQFVRDRIRYVRDVLGVETLSTPQMTLKTRHGDCDDQATLLATLYESIGFPTRFIVAGYEMPGVYDHVYLQVLVHGEWVSCDPTEPEGFGWDAPDAVAMMVES